MVYYFRSLISNNFSSKATCMDSLAAALFVSIIEAGTGEGCGWSNVIKEVFFLIDPFLKQKYAPPLP